MSLLQHTKFQRNPSSRFWDTERDTSARAHVRKYRCTPPVTCLICIAAWSIKTRQIWSQSAEPFLSYSLAVKFDTPHAARATCQGDPQNEPNPTVIKVAWIDLSPCENCMEIESTASEILASQKRRHGPGWAAYTQIFSDKPRKNSLRSLKSIYQCRHLSGCLRLSEDVWGGRRLVLLACISYFKGPPHQVTYPVGYWKAGIKALANKNILRLTVLYDFTKDMIIRFSKAMLQ